MASSIDDEPSISTVKDDTVNTIITAQGLLQRIRDIDADQLQTHPERQHLLHLSQKLTATLEDPRDRANDIVFLPVFAAVVRIAAGLDLFDHLAARDGVSMSTVDLAKATGADQAFLYRILRMLASLDFVDQVGIQEWRANATTRASAVPGAKAGQRVIFDLMMVPYVKAPAFFEKEGWRIPKQDAGLLQNGLDMDMPFFQYLQLHPDRMTEFNMYMACAKGSRVQWCDWFNIKGPLIDAFDSWIGETLLVDIGGGNGHDIQAFHNKFKGQYAGVLVLQDLAHAIHGIEEGALDESIRKMPIDFFTEQPIIGARIYFLHHILHDWSDETCQLILKHIHKAMAPGYSKLIIHELILPDVNAELFKVKYDLLVMLNNGMERSRSQWTMLLEKAGFVVLGIHEHADGNGIIEAEVAV